MTAVQLTHEFLNTLSTATHQMLVKATNNPPNTNPFHALKFEEKKEAVKELKSNGLRFFKCSYDGLYYLSKSPVCPNYKTSTIFHEILESENIIMHIYNELKAQAQDQAKDQAQDQAQDQAKDQAPIKLRAWEITILETINKVGSSTQADFYYNHFYNLAKRDYNKIIKFLKKEDFIIETKETFQNFKNGKFFKDRWSFIEVSEKGIRAIEQTS